MSPVLRPTAAKVLAPLLALVLLTETSQAAFVTYSASDGGAGATSPRPNSDAMAAQFDAAAGALGTLGVLTFESSPLGGFSSLAIAPGVTITGSDLAGSPQTIRNFAAGAPDALYGYNTTAGGSQFLYAHGGTVTFTFGPGVQAFGAYISGIQFSGETITFDDGTTQTVPIPALGFLTGGVAFVGLTDAGKNITSVTIHATGSGGPDFLGIDDVRYGPVPTTVPEPPSVILAATGLLFGLIPLARRRTTVAA